MLPLEHPDRIHIAFDDDRLVANAGLILPVTLAHHLGLGELVDHHVDLGDAPGQANAGDKFLTLVASALAGGDCIDDADALRAGGTGASAGMRDQGAVYAGNLPAELTVGSRAPVGSGEPGASGWDLARRCGSWRRAVDHRPGLHHLRNLRPGQGGARDHGYTGQRGYHPLLAVAAGTGDVLMCRLRKGRANTARGAAHFLRETVGRCATPEPRVNSP